MALMFTPVPICIWFLYCINRTTEDRIKLINAIYARKDWDIARRMLSEVSYGDHYLAHLTLRNPWKLYREKARIGGYL